MKVAIVGCGVIATSHLNILKRMKPEVTISLCDPDRSRTQFLAAKFGVRKVFEDIADLLEEETPNAIHILTPPRTHAALAKRAILAGCHVFVEKPVTERTEEYASLQELAQQHMRVLCCDYSTLGMPVVMRALKVIRSGELGRLISVHCDFAGSEAGGFIPYKDPSHWAYSLKGGILQNMIDHPASLIVDVLDPIRKYHFSFIRRNMLPFDCPDLVHGAIYSEDQVGSFTLSLGHGRNERRAHFMLEKGSIVIDLGRQLYSCTRGSGPQNFIKKGLSGVLEGYAFAGGTIQNVFQTITGRLRRDPGIVNVMQSFYRTIDTNEELLVKHETVLAITRMLEEAWKQIDYHPSLRTKEAES